MELFEFTVKITSLFFDWFLFFGFSGMQWFCFLCSLGNGSIKLVDKIAN